MPPVSRPDSLSRRLCSTDDSTDLGSHWHAVSCAGLLAIKHANERDSSVTPAFGSLQKTYSYIHADTEGNAAAAVSSYRTLRNGSVVGVVGPATSAIATTVATVGGLDLLPIISHWASAPSLADKDSYPYFGRTFPSDDTRAPRMLEALRLFNFTVGVAGLEPRQQRCVRSSPKSSH